MNYFQTSGSVCTACSFGFRTVSSASIVCEPCPFGTIGHILGGCLACSPGSYRGDESSKCSLCEAGSYSGRAFPACIPCKHGEYSNGVGSTECQMCAPGSYSMMQSSYCTPCGINSASNLSSQRVCPTCLSGHVAPVRGMTECFPCPDQKNMSSWLRFVPHKLIANASEAELMFAISTIMSSCFPVSGEIRRNLTPDNVSASNHTVTAILCTVAGIILILGSYFLCKSWRHADCVEDSRTSAKIPDSIPISQMPDNVRTNMMIRLGGEYFHRLIQGRRRTSETIPNDVEMCGISDCHVEHKTDVCVPHSSHLIRTPLVSIEQRDVEVIEGAKEADEPPVNCPDHVPLSNPDPEELGIVFAQCAEFPTIALANLPIEEQEIIESSFENHEESAKYSEPSYDKNEHELVFMKCADISTKNANCFPESCVKVDDRQKSAAEPHQYHGKKYSIDLENVR